LVLTSYRNILLPVGIVSRQRLYQAPYDGLTNMAHYAKALPEQTGDFQVGC